MSVEKKISEPEATYMPQADRPTDRPDRPDEKYMSMRITCAHVLLYKIEEMLNDCEKYIIYPHLGKDKSNPHFHVCVPMPADVNDSTFLDRYRKRAKSINGGGAGKIMCKTHTNGVSSFVGYVKHEDGKAVIKGYEQEWFDEIKKMEEKNIGHFMEKKPYGKPRNEDHFMQITYQNMEKATLKWRARHGIKSKNLEDTLEDMFKHGWRFQISVEKNGIPQTFFEQFTAQCDGSSIYKASRFVMMRKVNPYIENN